VRGKNFRPICGKPLIDWSLDLLLDNPLIDTVVVSTDSEEIYEHALSRGTLDIGLRPAHLATDTAAKFPVWQHALAEVEQRAGPAEIFLDLDCTSPLRLAEDIEGAIALFRAEQPDMVMSVTEARKNPYFNLVEPDDSGALHISKPLQGVVARQQAPVVWEHVGVVYAVAPDYLRRAERLMEGRVIPYPVPTERCHDVDSEYDWKIVEFLLSEQIRAGLR
jgi:N-acylneuraminate cytidylyltransferase